MLPPPTGESEQPKEGIRELTQDEIKTLEPIFTAAGTGLPDPAISTFIGKVVNGEVVAFLVLQLRLHAEPVWIKEGYSQNFLPLVSEAEKVILRKVGPQWVYLFAPAGKVAQLAQSVGMQIEPWVVLSRLVMPEAPAPITIDLDALPVEGQGVQ